MSLPAPSHPTGHVLEGVAYVGRSWMVTGPEFEDGTGWSLCYHAGTGKCQKCVATFQHRNDAMHAAHYFNRTRYRPRNS